MEDNKYKKYLLLAGLIISIVTIMIPIFLEFFIFRNDVISPVSNGDWAGFYGSFLGGIIGGIGTLIAVFITTKETRKIQAENTNQIENEKKIRIKQERKVFTDEIATLVAKNIAELKMYNTNTQKIQEIDKKLKEEEKYLNSLINETKISKSKTKIEMLTKEKELYNVNKSIADETYYLLSIKLKDIDLANELLQKLRKYNSFLFDKSEMYEDLEEKAREFINSYMNL
ncbi:hypothetical protein P5E79_11345 [Clostridium perfringens]|uniref:Uncharacterized protein n=2 Tax=Clostridium perfringens TaxID=1502 RepID=A0AAP7BV46_CLOPF|nr:hypothetical protein [Clostridium perfringens]EDT23496.1 hypothetical protein AC1_2118 [Clostridium perfringens B str. ATCC 3626]MBI6090737.1 hypothetical protein [Clostridium perfringens]MDK0774556.1 hypothetical protein [Clostridium perfringens]MDK0779747.1 hypothetical protein [Clostridium perfringens]MDM0581800.1 hypothetical protein [Clostridium perfringens]